jgi:hypothetical protein
MKDTIEKYYPIRSTPWGDPQQHRILAPGIISVSTARHGGIFLSPERCAQLPAPLKLITTWQGEPAGRCAWFEEDVDAILVILAFPQFFSGHACHCAVRAARDAAEPIALGTLDQPVYRMTAALGEWLKCFPKEAAPAVAKAAEFEQSIANKWERGGLSSGSEDRAWRVDFYRNGQHREVRMADYPKQAYYSDAELAAVDLGPLVEAVAA